MRETSPVTPPAQAPSAPGPLWTAAAVARRLGVAPATLRSWSLRYGIGPMDHFPGRHRRYSDADVAELDAMRALVGQGMVLPTAAAIVRSQRLGGATDDHVDPHGPIRAPHESTRDPAPATANDLVQLQQHVCSNTNNVAANMSEMIKVSHVLFVISEHSRKIDEKLRACEHQRIKAESVLRSLNLAH